MPDDGLPAEFSCVAGACSSYPTTPTAYLAGAICAAYPSATDISGALFTDNKSWHGSVHTAGVGGAADPLFVPWHTTVDTVWANWQQCDL